MNVLHDVPSFSNSLACFGDFIKKGRYQNRQKSTGKKMFYRFYEPEEKRVKFTFDSCLNGIKVKRRLDPQFPVEGKPEKIQTSSWLSAPWWLPEWYQFRLCRMKL
jgi:hypothetical protein